MAITSEEALRQARELARERPVAGGVRATKKTITQSEATLRAHAAQAASVEQDNGFISSVTGFFGDTISATGDIIEDPSSLLSGAGTYAGGVVNGIGESIGDAYDSVASSIGSAFSPSDTVLPDDLENYTLDADGNVIPLNTGAPDADTDPNNIGGNNFVSNLNATGQLEPAESKYKDWRVKLVLPDGADYLYKAPNPGILKPLLQSGGLIFPYTPTINVQHQANYANYDLTHSNYRGYFYTGSTVQNVMINATFTAQDTAEANYMLAALHFLKSCTKMFYGQDSNRGMPPPVVMLTGLGEYQYNNHPGVITTMNYNLPNDVDYIAAGVPDDVDPTANFSDTIEPFSGHVSWSSKIGRMVGAGLDPQGRASPMQSQVNNNNNPLDTTDLAKIYKGKTYVPTKIDINFMILPIQTRKQVSTEFSLREYANGNLLKRGFW